MSSDPSKSRPQEYKIHSVFAAWYSQGDFDTISCSIFIIQLLPAPHQELYLYRGTVLVTYYLERVQERSLKIPTWFFPLLLLNSFYFCGWTVRKKKLCKILYSSRNTHSAGQRKTHNLSAFQSQLIQFSSTATAAFVALQQWFFSSTAFGINQIPHNGEKKWSSTTQTGWGWIMRTSRQGRDTLSKSSKPPFPISGCSSKASTDVSSSQALRLTAVLFSSV